MISLLELANYTVTGFAYKTLVEIPLIVPVTLLVIRVLPAAPGAHLPAPAWQIHRDDDPALAPAASRRPARAPVSAAPCSTIVGHPAHRLPSVPWATSSTSSRPCSRAGCRTPSDLADQLLPAER